MSSAPIDYFSLRHPLRRLASRVALRVRRQMFADFMAVMQPGLADRILDVGVTPDRSLPDSNFFEKWYPYPQRVVATSIEDAAFLQQEHPGLKFVQTGKAGLPFRDRAFDIVFCSAVIEHVGDRRHQRRFLGELLRIAQRFFILTPNRLYPIEFHTFLPLLHWLPTAQYQSVLRLLGMGFWSQTENLNLLTPYTLQTLFPTGSRVAIRRQTLLGLPSNIIAYGKTPLPV